MIVVRLVGRLGNQLFQYAFALAEQKRLKTFSVIDDRYTEDVVAKYFDVKGLTNSKIIKSLVFRYNRFKEVTQLGGEEVEDFIRKDRRSFRSYYAHVQSEKYFSAIKNEIGSKIRVKRQFQDEFNAKYGEYFTKDKILVIHYRFGDYLEWGSSDLGGKNVSLPETYYSKAISKISNLNDYFIILVTDDIQACETRTKYLERKIVISDSEIMDFQIIQNADKVIIANSTFSWWAAYLNKKSPEVLAPKYWLGFKVKTDFPKGIMPEKFTEIEF